MPQNSYGIFKPILSKYELSKIFKHPNLEFIEFDTKEKYVSYYEERRLELDNSCKFNTDGKGNYL